MGLYQKEKNMNKNPENNDLKNKGLIQAICANDVFSRTSMVIVGVMIISTKVSKQTNALYATAC